MLQSCYVIQSISLPSQGNTQRLTEDISAIGGSALISLSPSVLDATNDYLVCRSVRRLHPDTRIQAFYKAEIGNCIYFSAHYGRVRKRNRVHCVLQEGWFTAVWNGSVLLHHPIPVYVVIKRLETIEVSS